MTQYYYPSYNGVFVYVAKAINEVRMSILLYLTKG